MSESITPVINTNKEKKNQWDKRSLSDNFMIIFIFAMSVFLLIFCILTFSENADKGFKFLEMFGNGMRQLLELSGNGVCQLFELFGNGVRQLLELSSKIFIEVYRDILKSTAEFIVQILEGLIAWIQSTSILIVYLYVIMIIVILMLVIERDNLRSQ